MPTFVTIRRPVTHKTMLDRFWISNRQLAQRSLIIAFYLSKEREVTLHTKLLRLSSSPEHDVHLLRIFTLNCSNQLRIETELHQRASFRRFRQLSLDNLVRPRSKLARSLNPQQKIRSPTPLTLNKRGLIDRI